MQQWKEQQMSFKMTHYSGNGFEIERVFMVVKKKSKKKLNDNESVETVKKKLWQCEKFLMMKEFK